MQRISPFPAGHYSLDDSCSSGWTRFLPLTLGCACGSSAPARLVSSLSQTDGVDVDGFSLEPVAEVD
jgi:hypothetical protein